MPIYIDNVHKACRLVSDEIVPRLRSSCCGIVFNDPIYCDIFFEHLQVVHIERVHILIPITIRPVKKERLEKIGYVQLKTPATNKDNDFAIYDPWSLMRSRKDQEYLSSAVLVQLIHSLLINALKNPHTIEYFDLQPLDLDRQGSIICIRHEQLKFTICLSFGVKIKKTGPFLITKPYEHDDYLRSQNVWRISYIESEMKCLQVLRRVDHFRYAQAIKILLAIVKLNRTFAFLNEDIIKALLLLVCDNDLIHQDWHQRQCNDIFWSLIDVLYIAIDSKILKHPYLPDMNLLEKIDRTKLVRLHKHLDYIIEHQHEFERFLNRRILSSRRRRQCSQLTHQNELFGVTRNESIIDNKSPMSSDNEQDAIHS
jgi:hypothetical protein